MEKLQTVRGTHDILPDSMHRHQYVLHTAQHTARCYGFYPMQTPIFERTEVFSRPLGDTSDIVNKEMYCFVDRNEDSITLRPEGTAGVMRAFIQHGLSQSGAFKVFYQGPMFRYERPQKGRQRQFHQFGIEAIGIAHPHTDIEIIAMGYDILKRLGLMDKITLEINSLGDLKSRDAYRHALVDYLTPFQDTLSEDSQKRLHKNPLRILDSKNPNDQDIIKNAPVLQDYLNDSSTSYFAEICRGLDALDIPYTHNTKLVRGMDYYCHTAFEFTTDALGAQGTVIGGGRYDGLCKMMGGGDSAGIGFAGGVERLCLMLENQDTTPAPQRGVVTIAMGDMAQHHTLKIAHDLRNADIICDCTTTGNMKKRMKYADKINARIAIILGDDELHQGIATVRNLDSGQQDTIRLDALTPTLITMLHADKG